MAIQRGGENKPLPQLQTVDPRCLERVCISMCLPLQIMSAIKQYFFLGLDRWLSSEERALGAFEEDQGSIPTW